MQMEQLYERCQWKELFDIVDLFDVVVLLT